MKTSITKATLILCLQLVLTVAAYANTENDGLKCKLESYKCENGKGITTYTVYSEEGKSCDISFIAFPAEDTESNIASYTVNVNGTEVSAKITFAQSGLQEAHTAGKAITLNKGDNTISFTSNGKDIPQVKGIEIFKNKKRLDAVSSGTFAEKTSIAEAKSRSISAAEARYNKPPYRRGSSMNQLYANTTCMPLYYEAGQRASFYGPTKWDTMYGMYASTVEFNVYLFHENPELFSASASSDSNKWLIWDIDNIPYTGIYYLLIEAKYPGSWGGVTLLMDNKYLYKYSFASNTNFDVYKEMPMGQIYVSDKNSDYNIFTVNSRSCETYRSSDPSLWLKKIDNNTREEVVIAYNDNNSIPSDFNWDKNARIRTKLSDETYYKVLLSSNNASLFVNDTCDIYHSFWNTPTLFPEWYENPFPYLKNEDTMESFNNDDSFNCIAWTCGDNNTWLWPAGNSNEIKWFDQLYNNETVQSGLGNYKRADGSLKYTREGATEENSVIDLWGIIANGEFIFTHGSIRKYSDDIPHGYDWESKCGAIQQIFHPRYALRGGSYGQVVAHYRIADNQTVSNRSSRSIMAEAIADGELVIDNITLTPEEEYLLAEGINNIPAKKRDGFDALYNNWKLYTDARGYESNMWKFRNCREYTELLAYTNSIPDGELLAYDKFVNGNLFAAVLISDLSTNPDSETQPVWNSIMNAPLKDNTIRTPRANVTLFIKAVLEKTEANDITEGIKQSNDDDFNVTVSSSQITVDVDLQQAAKYSIQVMNLQNDYTYQLSPEQTVEKGKYTHKCDVEPGLYIVTYKLNGNINSKKIIVR